MMKIKEEKKKFPETKNNSLPFQHSIAHLRLHKNVNRPKPYDLQLESMFVAFRGTCFSHNLPAPKPFEMQKGNKSYRNFHHS
jgi:hypothetical protein